MNTLSNERLEDLSNAEYCKSNPGKWLLGLTEVNAMARELLALRKEREAAVPVAWIVHARTGDQLTQDGGYVANAEGMSGIHSTPLYAAPPAPDIGEIRVGRLATMNQDEYPGLGDWWVQLRIGEDSEEVLARVYGATPQEAKNRAEALAYRAAMHGATISNSADIAIDEASQATAHPAPNYDLFVQGVVDDGENCAYADDDDAHYFTVYRRNADGTADALMDFTNRVNALWAISLVKKLNKLPESKL